MVDIKNITVTIDRKKILNNICLQLLPGSITCLIGGSGAGKTTMLKALAGLITIDTGTITLDKKNIGKLSPSERAEVIGYVFQQFNLFPHLTVIENCIAPQLIHGRSREEAEVIARQTLIDLGMLDFVNRYSSQLSGGQQQRVAIARALCLSPKVLLLDEPTASLDPENTSALIAIIEALAASGITIITSSQDMSFVKQLTSKLCYLENGSIVETCTTKNYQESPRITRWLYR